MRSSKWVVVAVALPLCALGSARETYAQESAAEKACMALPTNAQSGCLEKLYNAADARLNDVYRRAVAVIENAGGDSAGAWKAELKKAQKAWVAFRDADCGALIGYEWGHGTGMGAATESCLLHKTEQRTRALVQRYLAQR